MFASVFCFILKDEGIASALIDRICTDAKANGYVAVEGYAKIYEGHNDYDYQGPVKLYQKSGFVEISRQDAQIIMRKIL